MAKCGDCIQQYERSKKRVRRAAAKKREAAQLEKPQPVQYQIRSADRFIPPGTNLTDLLNVLRLQQAMAGAANNPQTLTPSLERQRTTPAVSPSRGDGVLEPQVRSSRGGILDPSDRSPAILGTPQYPFITEQRTFPVAQIGVGQALLGIANSGGQALLGAASSGGRAVYNFLGAATEPELPGRALSTEAQPERDPQPPPRFFTSPVIPISVAADLAAGRAVNPLPQPPPPQPLLPESETPLPERTVLDLMEREPDPGLVPTYRGERLEEAAPDELDEFVDVEEQPLEVVEQPVFTASSLAGGGGELLPTETASSLVPRPDAEARSDRAKRGAETKRLKWLQEVEALIPIARSLGFMDEDEEVAVKKYKKQLKLEGSTPLEPLP